MTEKGKSCDTRQGNTVLCDAPIGSPNGYGIFCGHIVTLSAGIRINVHYQWAYPPEDPGNRGIIAVKFHGTVRRSRGLNPVMMV